MNGEKDCWNCVYGVNRTGDDVSCTNKYVNSLKQRPDPYDCEFCDKITDSYMDDIEKVMHNT